MQDDRVINCRTYWKTRRLHGQLGVFPGHIYIGLISADSRPLFSTAVETSHGSRIPTRPTLPPDAEAVVTITNVYATPVICY
jgi:hypothetical protein